MSWPSTKGKRVYAALLRIGWRVKRVVSGSHVRLERKGWEEYTWSFHDGVEIGPIMLKKIAKKTGLTPGDL